MESDVFVWIAIDKVKQHSAGVIAHQYFEKLIEDVHTLQSEHSPSPRGRQGR
jgi:hypothetical protein